MSAGTSRFPSLQLGAAYDQAMADPRVHSARDDVDDIRLRARRSRATMRRRTRRTVDGKPALAVMELNYSIIPLRPAGAAWSNIRDMLKYVQMELDDGTLAGWDALRRKGHAAGAPGAAGQDRGGHHVWHGTDGGHEIWHASRAPRRRPGRLPQRHDVAAGAQRRRSHPHQRDPGWILRAFRRKLLEVLFDGRPEADADVAAQAKSFYDQLAAERKLLTIPAAAADAAKLAPHYINEALGDIAVSRDGRPLCSTSASGTARWRRGTTRTAPCRSSRLPPGSADSSSSSAAAAKPSLIVRDAQHEYVFAADGAPAAEKRR